MALMLCRECGRQVSSLALNCPHCGAPQSAGSHPQPPPFPMPPPPLALQPQVVTVEKNKYPCLTIVGVAFLALLALGFVGAMLEDTTAKFAVTDALNDENCTQLGDYCLQVHCVVQNTGKSAGQHLVRAQLFRADGAKLAEKRQNLTLLPGASQRVTFRFPEAELDSDGHKYLCDLGGN